MAKYRKRPAIVEAWRWTFGKDQDPAPSWMMDAMAMWPIIGGIAFWSDHTDGRRFYIATLGGVLVARSGDWIVRGVAGEIYPMRDDIFRATYEPVEEPTKPTEAQLAAVEWP